MLAHAVGGGGSVLLTDRDNECLTIAAENILANNVRAETSLLSWSDHTKATEILVDLKDKYDKQGFDIIIGSDCLYSGTEAIKSLFSVVAYMLSGGDAGINCDKHQDYRGGGILSCSDELKIDIQKTIDTSSIENIEDGSDMLNTDIDDVEKVVDTSMDYLVPTSGDGGGWMMPISPNQRNISNSSLRPVFVLGYERRLGGADVDMSAMFKVAFDLGFEWCIAEDSVIDIFGNETEDQTMFWEQCVFLFTRRKH